MGDVVPVTLLTGSLGAGKTSLLNHILEHADGVRFAVVENEFGDEGIDSELVDPRASQLFNLNEGCVCCTVRENLANVFTQLADASDIDHVIIEASGLADPGPVMRVVERMSDRFVLHGVIAVVDACHAQLDRASHHTWSEQLAFADLIVVNKVSLANAEDVAVLQRDLAQLNPLAEQVQTDFARVDVQTALSMRQHDAERIPTHSHHHHDDGITSVVATVDGDIDGDRLDAWLGTLVRGQDMELLRMKGFLALPGQPSRFIFHAVRQQLDVRPGSAWGDDPRQTRIVFIGRQLDASVLQAGLTACANGRSA